MKENDLGRPERSAGRQVACQQDANMKRGWLAATVLRGTTGGD